MRSSRRAATSTWCSCTAAKPDIAVLAERVWYPIWDSGLRLDHSVRTPAQACEVAREDLKAVLGLISARHVAGDPDLTREVRETVLMRLALGRAPCGCPSCER